MRCNRLIFHELTKGENSLCVTEATRYLRLFNCASCENIP